MTEKRVLVSSLSFQSVEFVHLLKIGGERHKEGI